MNLYAACAVLGLMGATGSVDLPPDPAALLKWLEHQLTASDARRVFA